MLSISIGLSELKEKQGRVIFEINLEKVSDYYSEKIASTILPTLERKCLTEEIDD